MKKSCGCNVNAYGKGVMCLKHWMNKVSMKKALAR